MSKNLDYTYAEPKDKPIIKILCPATLFSTVEISKPYVNSETIQLRLGNNSINIDEEYQMLLLKALAEIKNRGVNPCHY